MRDRLWIVSFWHQLLYPELGPAGYEDPTGVLASAARRLFGSDQPDYVVAARIHYGEATEHEQQRKTAAVVLRHLHSSFSFDERRLLGFVHGRFLYFCGRFQNASQPSSASTELARRLRALVAHLRQEHGILFTVGVSPDAIRGSAAFAGRRNMPWSPCAYSCRRKKAACLSVIPPGEVNSALWRSLLLKSWSVSLEAEA